MLHRIKLHQLRAFDTLMRTRSMTRGAEVLNTTQPTISRQIQALESAIGFSLFVRGGSGQLLPSREGEQFYKEIGALLRAIDDLPSVAQGIHSYSRKRIKILATLPMISSEHFILATDEFAEQQPDVQMMVNLTQRPSIENAIAGGQGDIGFCVLPIEHPALTSVELIEVSTVAVVPATHPLANKRTIELAELTEEPLVLSHGRPIVPDLPDLKSAWSRSLPTQIDTRNGHLAVKLASLGKRITICDPVTALSHSDDRVRIVPVTPKLEFSFGYVLARDAVVSPEMKALIEQVSLQFKKLQKTLDDLLEP